MSRRWAKNTYKEKMFFVKGMPPFGKQRTHHIHIVEHKSNYWQGRILLRDYLRTHPEDANRYAQLKLKLMKEHTLDREAYTDVKCDFVSSILKKAGFKEKVKR
nr:GrpB family protein [Candidatus Odyssella thessalonicensis]